MRFPLLSDWLLAGPLGSRNGRLNAEDGKGEGVISWEKSPPDTKGGTMDSERGPEGRGGGYEWWLEGREEDEMLEGWEEGATKKPEEAGLEVEG